MVGRGPRAGVGGSQPARFQPVEQVAGAARWPARCLDRQADEALHHVAVVSGGPGAVLDQVDQRGGELARRQLPQRQAGLVRPDGDRPDAGLAKHPPEPVGDAAGIRAALGVEHHQERRGAEAGRVPAQARRHERGPEPQEQGCLARPRHADDELVRPQPLVSDRREPSGAVADSPDHGPDDDQIAPHGERHRAGRRDPGPGRALLAPPLPLVEGDSGGWGPAADASAHGLGSVCPGERRGRQAERDRRRRDGHHGARKRSGRGQVPER